MLLTICLRTVKPFNPLAVAGLQPSLKARQWTAARTHGTALYATEAGHRKQALVIVESPAKARTIQKFLDEKEYTVDFCLGHIRDLARARSVPKHLKKNKYCSIGVDVPNDFTPLYVELSGKEEVVKRLKKSLGHHEELILATDEDREGEAISWHLLQVLAPPESMPIKRAVFHEITRPAITEAFNSPRELDQHLVAAQETRRILDRLAGFTMSPLLMKKVAPRLSAGRVQSVGMALVVDRERQRLKHRPAVYFDATATVHLAGETASTSKDFEARLVEVDGRRVAGGKDFSLTGELLETSPALWLQETDASELVAVATGWHVGQVTRKEQRRRPPRPFTTSALQQESNRRVRLSAADTMRTAQRLYEAGFITYMRTDSASLSASAYDQAVSQVRETHGQDHVGTGHEKGKAQAFAQEAHEAIRPAIRDGAGFPTVSEVAESFGQASAAVRVYDLILRRTLASVMADAVYDLTGASVTAELPEGGRATFRANGKTVKFSGFLQAYEHKEGSSSEAQESPAERRAGGDEALEDDDSLLPALEEGQDLVLVSAVAREHSTAPPPRYTEASFVKELEQCGVGRPSTYAQIVETLKERNYVSVQQSQLIPSLTAFVVTSLLENHCPSYVKPSFTASMEATLDRIAAGDADRSQYLSEYFLGEQGLEETVQRLDATVSPEEARRVHLPHLCGSQEGDSTASIELFLGPYGVWAERRASLEDDQLERVKIPSEFSADASSLNPARLDALLSTAQPVGRVLGTHPDTQLPVSLKVGPYGPYIQHGQSVEGPEDSGEKAKTLSVTCNAAFPREGGTMSMDQAVRLLALPREVAVDPEDGGVVTVGIGRYGPFIRFKGAYHKLPASEDPLEISEERALEVIAVIRATPAGQRKGIERDFGEFEGQRLVAKRGRFGVYLSWGKVRAAIPKDLVADIDSLPEDMAQSLVKDKLASGSPSKGGAKAGKKSTSGKKKSSKGATKKRKATAWSLFCADRRPELMGTEGLSLGAAMQRLGEEWKGLDEAARGKYEKSAAEQDPSPGAGANPRTPRRRTAYQIFVSERRKAIAESSPSVSFGEVSKELGRVWRELSALERAQFEEKAANTAQEAETTAL